MQATILTVGDEILIGQVVDTNATYMAAALSEEGITVVEHLSVADSRMGIMSGLDRALQQSDLVLMTGGLGPTKDDITKLVLADYFGAELRLHTPTWNRLQKLYARYGRQATDSHKEQCRLPTGAKILVNERGTAPGLWLEKEDQIVVSMPGVPYEMAYLMEHEVMRRLKRRQLDADLLRSVTLLTAGEGESVIAERLEQIEDSLPPHMGLAYLPSLGTVRLRLSARGDNEGVLQNELRDYRQQIERALGDLVYGYGKDDLASVVAHTLQDRKQTLATAESCTGGYLGSQITAHPGSSAYYLGGVVAYSNPLKVSLLDVSEATLAAFGAVSQETVTAMAEGARARLGADYALATSGIAGPGGGSTEKPVGTIWIALATPERTVTKLLRSGKDRQRNIEFTSLQALNLLRLELGTTPVLPEPKPVPAPEPEPAPKKKGKPKAAKSAKRAKPAPAPAEIPAAEVIEVPAAPKRLGRRKPLPAKEVAPETASTPVAEEPAAAPKAKRSTRAPRKPKSTPAAVEVAESKEPAPPAKPKRTPRKKPAAPPANVPPGDAALESTDSPAKPKRTPRRKK